MFGEKSIMRHVLTFGTIYDPSQTTARAQRQTTGAAPQRVQQSLQQFSMREKFAAVSWREEPEL